MISGYTANSRKQKSQNTGTVPQVRWREGPLAELSLVRGTPYLPPFHQRAFSVRFLKPCNTLKV